MTQLTEPQQEELRRLGREPQGTFGKGRARVQNNLVALGLARLEDDGYRCVITDAGRAALLGDTASSPSPHEDPPTIPTNKDTWIRLALDTWGFVLRGQTQPRAIVYLAPKLHSGAADHWWSILATVAPRLEHHLTLSDAQDYVRGYLRASEPDDE